MERDIPCRVSADLRALDCKQTADILDAPEFTYMDCDFKQIVPAEMAMPLEHLFSTRDQIDAIKGSFGDNSVDCKKSLEWLLEDISRLEEQILILWENA